ncbi:PTS sugar transporter subunit IIA [Staphylococcus lentus]|uniref:PTS sugar transporter subunit IIA n=1 Tax=Mammaliicoccus lentus TaxID=42858 RepID=UPI00188388C2|nr:PTS sugar transporter subunit IIA [Mammaliicoccus lentus]MBF0840390.1 PTS sugar transporter subunit IIA [Mammaliicoccus lentus]
MALNDYFKEELIFFIENQNKEKVLDTMAYKLCEKGYVKESYPEAVVKREIIYPTGLASENYGVAIPHTDTWHVNEPTICISILKEPIKFIEMGSKDDYINVNMIFMLAMKEPEKQIELLQFIIELIQNEKILAQLKECETSKEVMNILTNKKLVEILNRGD